MSGGCPDYKDNAYYILLGTLELSYTITSQLIKAVITQFCIYLSLWRYFSLHLWLRCSSVIKKHNIPLFDVYIFVS